MTVPFPLGQIFVPGKIIQIPRENAIEQLALIEVEEHIRHVRVMLDWLYPDASDNLKMAADWHDIGKKIDLWPDYANKLNVLSNHPDGRRHVLTDDFYGRETVDSVTPYESAEAYIEFLINPQKKHIRSQRWGYHLDPPFFGFHASTVQHNDLPKDLEDSDQNYIINLIHLHHRFSPEQLVEAAADHGEDMLKDLYQLIVADHFASEWATNVVHQLEGVDEKESNREWRFAEKTLNGEDAQDIKRDGNVVFGQITLNCESQQLKLNVNYYLQDFHFDGT